MTDTTKCLLDCGRPAGRDAYACKDCAAAAATACDTIAALIVHADDKRARVTGIDYSRAGVRSSTTVLPYDPRVTQVCQPIIVGLAGTHDVIAEHVGWHDALRGAAPADVALWVKGRVATLRTIPEGPEEMRFLLGAARSIERLFDRAPDRLYLGRCEAEREGEDGQTVACEAHVYVEAARTLPATVTCPRCHATIDVAQRREEFAEAVAGYQATMREMVKLAPLFLEEGVSRSMLYQWVGHGLLTPAGTRVEYDREGRRTQVPTYRVGALADARRAWGEQREEARARRQAAKTRRVRAS